MSGDTVHRGPIKVTVGDTTWTMVADFNALCDFQDATGVSASKFLGDLEDKSKEIDALLVRQFVLATLLEHHPKANLRDAGRVISADGDALVRAIDAALPDPPADGDAASGEDQAATG
ncbi:hypothetical protein [uncultured Tateyamaria sp.]|uniref:hypothetical protein n=1 Tax=uncultured Tateyamaria sp. TaxID=455651 RepID=UPI00262FC1A8|nr:hypothetical protein [uncultured Tateyamaria sp.]